MASTLGLVIVINQGIAHALRLVRERYEEPGDSTQILPFHSRQHTVGVIRRATLILRAMHADERAVQLGRLAAAFHDTVRLQKPHPSTNNRDLCPHADASERASAAEAVAWMRQYPTMFTDEDCDLVTAAIMATVTCRDAEKKTIYQPNLMTDSHHVVRAVALADLGVCGIEGNVFAKEGDLLFREKNIDILRVILRAKNHSDIPPKEQEAYKNRILAWAQIQADFVRCRKARLEIELGNLDDVTKKRVRSLFTGFEEAADAVNAIAAHREKLTFWEIARDMGYTVPTA